MFYKNFALIYLPVHKSNFVVSMTVFYCQSVVFNFNGLYFLPILNWLDLGLCHFDLWAALNSLSTELALHLVFRLLLQGLLNLIFIEYLGFQLFNPFLPLFNFDLKVINNFEQFKFARGLPFSRMERSSRTETIKSLFKVVEKLMTTKNN